MGDRVKRSKAAKLSGKGGPPLSAPSRRTPSLDVEGPPRRQPEGRLTGLERPVTEDPHVEQEGPPPFDRPRHPSDLQHGVETPDGLVRAAPERLGRGFETFLIHRISSVYRR